MRDRPEGHSGANLVILMATWNGAQTLRAQLESFQAQSCLPQLLLVSDDGSQDQTCAILAEFAQSEPGFRVQLCQGPKRGAAQNFLSLMRAVPPGVEWLAFSDQDDVWLPQKLARGIAALAQGDADQPALIGGRSFICGADLTRQGISARPARAPSFRHALVQNFAGGNTMMLNRAGIDLMRAAAGEAGDVVVHDWWLYQLITGAGGRVLFEEEPLLLYRQHSRNQIGANTGLRAKCTRLRWMVAGHFRAWNRINLAALSRSAHRLTAENRALLGEFSRLQQAGLWQRLTILYRAGFYRQRWEGRLSLWLAAVLGRI